MKLSISVLAMLFALGMISVSYAADPAAKSTAPAPPKASKEKS